jgi:signal transduction histidine kinase
MQIDKSLSRVSEGSGIGLALVKSIVEMHEGNIYVNSELEKGTEFIIELPAKVLSENVEV